MPILIQYPSINLEGSILHPDVLATRLQDASKAMTPAEISEAYVMCRTLFRAYQLGLEKVGGYTAQRAIQEWGTPLLSRLGYTISSIPNTPDSPFRINYQDGESELPIYLKLSYRKAKANSTTEINLDARDETNQSPHAHLQQYLNATEATYGLIFNGVELRLLRDAARMSRPSYVSFNLATIFEQDLFADFTLLCLILHQVNMPKGLAAEALDKAKIEQWYLASLSASSRIREKLSQAIANTGARQFGDGAILKLINGLLTRNTDLLSSISAEPDQGVILFNKAIRLVYRILFLSVVEERNLTHNPDQADLRDLYLKYYSVKRLRRMVTEGEFALDGEATNLWDDLMGVTFALFEDSEILTNQRLNPVGNLGIDALRTGLWARAEMAIFKDTTLSNKDFIAFLKPLSQFENEQKILVPINYGALDVEEMGSIYEGLLALKGKITTNMGLPSFGIDRSTERAATGSHYTPESLVQPLLQHSLDYLIEDARNLIGQANQVKALLALRILDPACGSGHILLSAARRLALALAQVRNEDPQPEHIRAALREVISQCIYGVDINPMALDLCKMAFWLEAHQPGKPLTFLDHHLQCGDALVGLTSVEELKVGIADEAYASKPALRQRNKQDAKIINQISLTAANNEIGINWNELADAATALNLISEGNADDVMTKTKRYNTFKSSATYIKFRKGANLKLAPYFWKADAINYTSQGYREHFDGRQKLTAQQIGEVEGIAAERKFLHWFLAFADVMQEGGFDLVVGNPPFLGGKKLSGTYGDDFLQFIKSYYAPIGAIDLVAYFLRRADMIVKKQRFYSFIATNTIAQGNTRVGGLDVLVSQGNTINHAVRSMRWPGLAAVEVALVTLYKGSWDGTHYLSGKQVNQITPYLDDAEISSIPYALKANENKSFIGSYVLGKGFVLEPTEAKALIAEDPNNADVIKPYLNGDDLNSRPDQSPSRWVINFRDWPLRRMTNDEWHEVDANEEAIINQRIQDGKTIALAPPNYTKKVAADYPNCLELVRRLVKPQRDLVNRESYRLFWWHYAEKGRGLYRTIAGMERVLVVAKTAKHFGFFFTQNTIVLTQDLTVMAFADYSAFALLQSSFINEWTAKNVSGMGAQPRFSPTDCFENLAFPDQIVQLTNKGETYYMFRQNIMYQYQIGLTELYNLFHQPEPIKYATALLVKQYPELMGIKGKKYKDQAIADHQGLSTQVTSLSTSIVTLRQLHITLDIAVRDAYNWQDITLDHGFHEAEYLPEDDRMRFTISEAARKEVLKRLLLLNHKRRLLEEEAEAWSKPEWVLRVR